MTINIQGGPGEIYNLTTISVDVGACVAIAYHNGDPTLDHTFTIDSNSAEGIALFNIFLTPGQSKTLNFQAPNKAMSIKYYCAVPGHEAAGMSGTMKVQSSVSASIINSSNGLTSSQPTINTSPGFELMGLLPAFSIVFFIDKIKKVKLKK